MLVIRLFRIGKKNQPSFKIVVTDKENPPRGGRFVEEIGFYNALSKQHSIKKERAEYWISKGAKPSDTVHNLLVKEGIVKGQKIAVHKKAKNQAAPEGGEPRQEGPEEKPKVEEAKKAA